MGPTDAAIVLLGDYVDKGPSSRGVLEFVRALETAFPRNIVAMMGNHDLFALLDVTMREGADRPMGMPVSEYAFAFPHPQQYVEAGGAPARDDDAELLNLAQHLGMAESSADGQGQVGLRPEALEDFDHALYARLLEDSEADKKTSTALSS